MNEKAIKRHERLLELQREAKERVPEIIKKLYESGTVSSVPTPDEIQTLSEGWRAEFVKYTEQSDVWMVSAESGKTLEKHNHPNKTEIVLMLSGRCRFKINKELTQDLDQLQSLVIPPGVDHEITAITNSKMVVVFQPPLSDPEFVLE